MATDRHAEVTWNGSLLEGSGRIDSVTSGVLDSLPRRPGRRAPRTLRQEPRAPRTSSRRHTPAASRWLSRTASPRPGTPADELKTSATVTFQPGEGITRIALTVRGRVPGIDAPTFQEQAEAAKENCPVSQALAAVPEITLEAELVD